METEHSPPEHSAPQRENTTTSADDKPRTPKRNLPKGCDGKSLSHSILRGLADAIQTGLYRSACPTVLVWGPTGSGKTTTALRFYLGFTMNAGRTGMAVWHRADDILDEIMAWRFGRVQGEAGATTVDLFARADFAVLDEVGTAIPTGERGPALLKLVDSRVGKPTIYTSNLAPKELVKLFDERIVARLTAGTVIEAAPLDLWARKTKFVKAQS